MRLQTLLFFSSIICCLIWGIKAAPSNEASTGFDLYSTLSTAIGYMVDTLPKLIMSLLFGFAANLVSFLPGLASFATTLAQILSHLKNRTTRIYLHLFVCTVYTIYCWGNLVYFIVYTIFMFSRYIIYNGLVGWASDKGSLPFPTPPDMTPFTFKIKDATEAGGLVNNPMMDPGRTGEALGDNL
jgi:hypothetical protein